MSEYVTFSDGNEYDVDLVIATANRDDLPDDEREGIIAELQAAGVELSYADNDEDVEDVASNDLAERLEQVENYLANQVYDQHPDQGKPTQEQITDHLDMGLQAIEHKEGRELGYKEVERIVHTALQKSAMNGGELPNVGEAYTEATAEYDKVYGNHHTRAAAMTSEFHKDNQPERMPNSDKGALIDAFHDDSTNKRWRTEVQRALLNGDLTREDVNPSPLPEPDSY